MKSNAIVRIVIYSLIILLLLGILLCGLFVDLYTSNTKAGTGEYSRVSSSFSAEKVSKLEIDWAAGSITINTADTDTITISESGSYDEKYSMVYNIEGHTLSIDYSKSTHVIGFGSLPEKDLVITVPTDWLCESLEIDGAALELHVDDITVNSIELDCAAMEVYFTGYFDKLDCDGAACKLNLTTASSPDSIDIDGASCQLDLTIPTDCGFLVRVDGIGCSFASNVDHVRGANNYYYGSQDCQINVDGMACKINICIDDPAQYVYPTIPAGQ